MTLQKSERTVGRGMEADDSLKPFAAVMLISMTTANMRACTHIVKVDKFDLSRQ